MKKLLPLTFAILTSTYTSTVNAENSWYLGALYNAQEISIYGRDFNAAGIIAGYQYNEYFALETRLSTGTSGYSNSFGIGEETVGSYSEDIDTQASLLVKASYPILNSFKLYGLAGYTNTKIEWNVSGQFIDSEDTILEDYPRNGTISNNGFSYGLGLDYQLNENFNVFIDYQVLPDSERNSDTSRSWKSTTIGVNYAF